MQAHCACRRAWAWPCPLPCATAWTKPRSEEHTSELQSPCNLVCRLLLEKKKKVLDCCIDRVHDLSIVCAESAAVSATGLRCLPCSQSYQLSRSTPRLRHVVIHLVPADTV